jgi:hypothetical protein
MLASATATTASVPRLLPTTATSRAGKKSRCAAVSGISVPENVPCSGIASAMPTARPAYAIPTGAAQRRPLSSSEPTPSSGAVNSAPKR